MVGSPESDTRLIVSIETSLSEWMIKQPQHIVAVDQTEMLKSADLVARATLWANSLSDVSGDRWAVYHENAFEYLSILLALWQLGKTACVPGDNCLGTLERLKPLVDGFIGQFETEVLQLKSQNTNESIGWSVFDRDYDALEIYTSGSTGEPKPIAKSLRQIENELETIERLWGEDHSDIVISTVSHQHFYGMTFRLFWPFSSKRPFETHIRPCSEDVFHTLVKYNSYQLVTSPTHLSRLNPELDWNAYRSKCNKVLSSAAPLSREASFNAFKTLGCEIYEIYGSSETGAVAWRCQQLTEEDALWKCFPEVESSYGEKRNLKILSDYQREGCAFELSDLVEIDADGKFTLLGRLDRIVKVEGKRVSLNAIEQMLKQFKYIEDAKVLVLENRRVELAAVILLEDAGWESLRKNGRKALIKEYKSALSRQIESVVIPRKWRFVESYPSDPQGKIPQVKLEKMFQKTPDHWPVITDQTVTENEVSLTCYAQEELIYFNGHFEDNPILPGVVQVHWAQEMAQHFMGISLEFKNLEVIKFQQVIPPYRVLNINLKYDPEKKKVHFKYESEKGVHSSGRICFQ